MPDILLHWHCQGVTYSVKRLTAGTGFLLASGPDGSVRRGRRPLEQEVIEFWAAIPIAERCIRADQELGLPGKPRAVERAEPGGGLSHPAG